MPSPSEELKTSRDTLLSRFSNGGSPGDFQDTYTEAVDHYFRRTLQESAVGSTLYRNKRPFAVIAVGGYGRKELSLHSDIDIIILFGARIPREAKALSDEFFLPLWDLGLDVGYGVRNVRDCVSLSKNDFQVLTSLLDARFICGASPLFLSLMETLQKKVISKKTTAFARWLGDRGKIRMQVHGDASSLLEPHLKEGIGGLRDYHHVLWLAKALLNLRTPRDLEYSGTLSHNEYQELRDNLELLWLVRNHLHALSGRKNDRLAFEYQERIARRMGFRDREDFKAVEQFLGKLHTAMLSIKALHQAFTKSHFSKKARVTPASATETLPEGVRLHEKELWFDSATALISDPLLMIRIFESSASLGHPLSLEATRLVREFISLVDDPFRSSKEAKQSFLNILKGDHGARALDQAFETGFLDAFIPEFGRVRDRVQFDTYHIFPVGRHCLETVKHLKGLRRQHEIMLLDVFSELKRPESVLLAALFHDIGKVGRDHARRGVTITREILKRLAYPEERAEDILFLIRHHLLLVETATRRDLNDEKVVVQCARTIEDAERLKMLYLLTWADARATGPRAWSEWTANLVQELFFKLLHILKGNELATRQASSKVEQTQSEVRRFVQGRMDTAALEQAFEMMSPRYLLHVGAPDISDHLGLVLRLREKVDRKTPFAFVLEAKKLEWEGCWELTFVAEDRPGLFSDLAGVLALNNINILSAQIFTWRDRTAVDIFRVSDPPDPMHAREIWDRVEKNLEDTFKGKLSLSYRLERKAEPSLMSVPKVSTRPPEVEVDNSSSDFFTLVEVFADDRVGLLHLITRTLFELKLDIRIAKIATKVDQVADIFYVRDLEGQKVEDPEQVQEIKRALQYQLTRGPGTAS